MDPASYLKYGLLVIQHAQEYGDYGLCKVIIKDILNSFPLNEAIAINDKVNILTIANKIKEKSIIPEFEELYTVLFAIKTYDNSYKKF